MCGRSRCTLAPQRVAAAAGVPAERWRDREHYQPCYNVSPGFSTPVVRQGSDGQREVQTMRWGLIPSYTKPGDKPDFFRMFNARSESVAEKGVFKRLLTRHRCVVLLNGFYEWAKEGKHKQPYYIHTGPAEDDVMYMAGLFDCWEHASDGPMYSYTILTTDSSKRLQWLHDRMPVILPDQAAVERWLHQGELEPKTLAQLATPFNGEELTWHKVTPAMSNMRYQGADCAKELKRESIATFFKPTGGRAKGDDLVNKPARGKAKGGDDMDELTSGKVKGRGDAAGAEAKPDAGRIKLESEDDAEGLETKFADARGPAGSGEAAGTGSAGNTHSMPHEARMAAGTGAEQSGQDGRPQEDATAVKLESKPEPALQAAVQAGPAVKLEAAAAPVDVSTGVAADMAATSAASRDSDAFVATPASDAQHSAQPSFASQAGSELATDSHSKHAGSQRQGAGKRGPASPSKGAGSAAKKQKASPQLSKGQGKIDSFFMKNSK